MENDRLNQQFINACCDGDINTVKTLMSNNNELNLHGGLSNACYSGHMEIVKLLISKGITHFDLGLYYACYSGHMEIVKLLISKGATAYNNGLIGACKNGHEEIAELMISKGAHNAVVREPSVSLNLDDVLYHAIMNNRKKIVLLLLLKGANIDRYHIILKFEDIYYLLQKGYKKFGQFNNIVDECKKWKQEFSNTANELFIKDVANLLIEF